MVKNTIKLLMMVCAAVFITACGGPSTQYRNQINTKIASGNFDEAILQVDKAKNKQYKEKNALLFYLDKGALLYDAGRYQESESSLAIAENVMEELFTKSLSRSFATVLLNDNTTKYAGEIFERALMNMYRAMNYVFMGQRDEALVEARKATSFLSRYSSYMEGKSGYKDSPFAQYLSAMLFEESGQQDDARIAYNSARKLFNLTPVSLDAPYQEKSEESQDLTDTSSDSTQNQSENSQSEQKSEDYSDLNQSFSNMVDSDAKESKESEFSDVNKSFSEMVEDEPDQKKANPRIRGRLAHSGGGKITDGVPASSGAVISIPASSEFLFKKPALQKLARDNMGEIVFIHYNGPSAMKISKTHQIAWGVATGLVASMGESNAEYQNALRAGVAGNAITVAFPEYVQPAYSITSSEIATETKKEPTYLIEDISQVAKLTLQQKNAAIRARAIARATVKYVIANAAGNAIGQAASNNANTQKLVGIFAKAILHAGAAATEIADTRGWTTMPAQVRIARMSEKPGTHNVTVSFVNNAGMVVGQKVFENVVVEKGKRTYLHYRTAL